MKEPNEEIAGQPPKKARATKPKVAIKAQWTFPQNTLEQALEIPKAIEEQNGGNPMKADILAKAVGFNQPDWRFLNLLRSANQYGLVSGAGASAVVSIAAIGNDVIAPKSPPQRQAALLSAFRSVDDFRKVEDFYKGGTKLPENEFFENTLVREFNIMRDRVKVFIEIFTKNLDYLKAFRVSDTVEQHDDKKPAANGTHAPSKIIVADEPSKGRTFLDTCFVMMPFGHWFDSYYKDLFVPAIKDAGMESSRADELFSTGTVIEQIWEQIQKSKILLADLTGKNANVFYELGLAHAARKPVVFLTAKLEDVPFDLRHLRVIVYDINNPFWGEKLKADLTTQLKNAKNEPAKSVPQPFRALQKEEDAQ
jgi:hypothetical protein